MSEHSKNVIKGIVALILVVIIFMTTLIIYNLFSSTESSESFNSKPEKTVAAPPKFAGEKLPKFTLSCSYGSSTTKAYVFASDGSSIYFSSIVNQNNIDATQKSFELAVEKHKIHFKSKGGMPSITSKPDGSLIAFDYITDAILDRKDLTISAERLMSPVIDPSIGTDKGIYYCEAIDDTEILNRLKSAYDASESEKNKILNEENARPNKL